MLMVLAGCSSKSVSMETSSITEKYENKLGVRLISLNRDENGNLPMTLKTDIPNSMDCSKISDISGTGKPPLFHNLFITGVKLVDGEEGFKYFTINEGLKILDVDDSWKILSLKDVWIVDAKYLCATPDLWLNKSFEQTISSITQK